MCVIVNDLCGDAKHRAATYLRQRALERMEMAKVNGLTNRNMVAISVGNIEITSIYNKMISLSIWILSWRIRRHRTSELITRADTATLPVS